MTTHPEPTGEQLRDEGVTAALAADTAAHRNHRAAIEAIIDELVAEGSVFSAETIRARLDDDTITSMSPGLLPACLRRYSQHGRIVSLGWTTSARPERHCGPVRMWRGTAHNTSMAA